VNISERLDERYRLLRFLLKQIDCNAIEHVNPCEEKHEVQHIQYVLYVNRHNTVIIVGKASEIIQGNHAYLNEKQLEKGYVDLDRKTGRDEIIYSKYDKNHKAG
jgi:hypothetical protein